MLSPMFCCCTCTILIRNLHVYPLSYDGSCVAVYNRWLLTDSSGLSSTGASQPTPSCQSAQCTKPICCPGNCYFGSTLDFQYIAGSGKISVGCLKGSLQVFLLLADVILLVSHTRLPFFFLHWNHQPFLPSLCFTLSVSGVLLTVSFSISSPSFSLWMFCSAETREEERRGGDGRRGWRRGEVLPFLVKQQLGNSSGSNKGSTSLLWLMAAHAHQTITGLFRIYVRPLGSVTIWDAKHTKSMMYQ